MAPWVNDSAGWGLLPGAGVLPVGHGPAERQISHAHAPQDRIEETPAIPPVALAPAGSGGARRPMGRVPAARCLLLARRDLEARWRVRRGPHLATVDSARPDRASGDCAGAVWRVDGDRAHPRVASHVGASSATPCSSPFPSPIPATRPRALATRAARTTDPLGADREPAGPRRRAGSRPPSPRRDRARLSSTRDRALARRDRPAARALGVPPAHGRPGPRGHHRPRPRVASPPRALLLGRSPLARRARGREGGCRARPRMGARRAAVDSGEHLADPRPARPDLRSLGPRPVAALVAGDGRARAPVAVDVLACLVTR